MTNTRETSVMMPVEPDETILDAMSDALLGYDVSFDYSDLREIYTAIIEEVIQEQDG